MSTTLPPLTTSPPDAERLFAGPGEMHALCRDLDWAETPLGPVTGWPVALRAAARLALDSGFAMCLYAGAEHVLLYNDGYVRTLGEGKHPAALGHPAREVWPEVWSQIEPELARVLAGGPSVHHDDQRFVIERDGRREETFWTYALSPMRAEDGAIVGIHHVVTETTARVHAEAALRASEACYRALATASNDVVYRMSPDWSEMRQLDGRGFLSDTPASGRPEPSDGWLGRYIHPDDQARVTVAVDEAVRTRNPFALKHRVIRADGTLGWTSSRAVAVLDEAGGVVEWIGAARDVTDRQEAELALRESEAQYRTLFESIDEGFCVIERVETAPGERPDFRYLETNPAFARHSGLTGVVGRTLREVVPGVESDVLAHYDRVATTGEPARFEVRVAALGLWLEVHVARVGAPERRRIAVVFNNISERKQAESALQASEARLAAVFEVLPVGVSVMAPTGAVVLANHEMHRYLPTGIMPSRDDARRGRWRARHAGGEPVEGPDFPGARALRGESTRPGLEMLYALDDGRDLWTRVTGVPIRGEEDRVVGAVVVVTDIDALKRTADALRVSEARARALIANLPGGSVFVVDQDLRYQLAEGEAFRVTGFTTEAFVGRTVDDVLTPDLVERYTPYYRRALQGESFEVEHTSHGRTFLTRGTPLREGDQVVAVLAVSVDITERRQAETQLRASEERQAFLLKLSDAVGPLADPTSIQYAACQLLGEYLHVQRVNYADIQGDEYIIRSSYARGVAPITGRGPLATYAHARLGEYRQGGVIGVSDVATDPRFSEQERASYVRAEIAATASVTLLKADRWVASFAAHSSTPRPWTAVELSLVRETAERVWEAVERARVEAALRETEARLRTLVENVRDYAIFGLDAGGFVNEWTSGAERVKGYTAAEAVGQHLALFFTPEDVATGQVERELDEAAATGRAEREGWRVRKGGERFWVNEIATAVRDAAGTLRGFTKVSRDLTAQKLVEDERALVLVREQAARREAERAMVMRDEFLTVISHELRTPLSAILLWSRMLSAGVVPPAQQPRALASIEQSASAQKQLIEDLLDVSSMLLGKVQLSLREVELRSVIEAALTAVHPMAAAKGVAVTTDLGPRHVQARVDPERLQQVVWNLVSNAVKFTPAGGHVVVRLGTSARAARLEVNDTGQGIAPSFLTHIFERFRQADASITRVHGGLGLGLAIVRELVELHGGTIAATSAGEGQGATFTVELPRLEDSASAEGAGKASTAASSFPLSGTLTDVRVLLVEDETETREVLRWLLERCGARVTAAASADEALAAFDDEAEGTAGRFDVLVSDIGLPGKDGHELLTALRRRAEGVTLPALALTAYARGEDRQRTLASGFNAYLAKPVEPRQLIDSILALGKGGARSSGGLALLTPGPGRRAALTVLLLDPRRPAMGSGKPRTENGHNAIALSSESPGAPRREA